MVITALRGFKIPVAILDRFLEANKVQQTYGFPPFYKNGELDAGSKFLRANLDATAGPTKTRIFIAQAEDGILSAHAYVAYAWVMVYAQRRLDMAQELPDQAPPGFAALRSEMLGYANGGEEEALQVKRLEEEGEDPTAALYVILTYKRPYLLGQFPRKSDLRCDRCDEADFEHWGQRQDHRREVHGCEQPDLPEF